MRGITHSLTAFFVEAKGGISKVVVMPVLTTGKPKLIAGLGASPTGGCWTGTRLSSVDLQLKSHGTIKPI